MRLLLIVITIHFILGGLGIFIINRKLDSEKRKNNRVKFFVYLLIFSTVQSSVIINKNAFAGLSIIIFALGLFEILRLGKLSSRTPLQNRTVFITLAVFSFLTFFFSLFILLPSPVISVTYTLVIIFDGASQISGQIAGKRKILPVLSPGKTWEGLAGGTLTAVITSVILHGYAGFSVMYSFFFGLMVCFTSFAGDMAASAFKRTFNAKDFGNLLPGQGGMLDRFDSFLSTGAAVGILCFLTFFPLDQIDRNIAAYLCCSIVLAIILISGELLYFLFDMKAEYSRVFSHVLAGILSIFMIKYFTSVWYTVSLCIQSSIFIFVTKKMGIFSSHHRVVRTTNGSSLFFIGILLAYMVSVIKGDIALYILPIAILTISDPVASLSGLNRKSGYLPTIGGSVTMKTYAGSTGFFLSAFAIMLFGLSFFYTLPPLKILIFAVIISLIATVTEAMSSNGSDNLFIPVSVVISLLICAC
jgi:phosphatidate cytidylyltransferase